LNFGKENQKPIHRATLPEFKRYVAKGHFKPISMKVKIEAIIQFLGGGGKKAIITTLENLLRAVKGDAGTTMIR
jgi:carbamate kinase